MTKSFLIWSQSEDFHFIDLIKELVVSYVTQEECLILTVISMKGRNGCSYYWH